MMQFIIDYLFVIIVVALLLLVYLAKWRWLRMLGSVIIILFWLMLVGGCPLNGTCDQEAWYYVYSSTASVIILVVIWLRHHRSAAN